MAEAARSALPKRQLPVIDAGTPRKQLLSDVVSISRQFLRAVRLDADLGREDALSGYICQGTARALLESMAKQINETKQRAFTWTGPYGGGKSSLALTLCSLVSPNANLRLKAREVLGVQADDLVDRAFATNPQGWLVVPVVGKRADIRLELGIALQQAIGGKPLRKKQADVVRSLAAEAERRPNGVLVVVDELGKFLEAAATGNGDIGFFQDLAEMASRCAGRLVVVGILHQSFDAYAVRLGREARDEWSKVQGRYIDIPLVAGADEVVELVGRAISLNEPPDLKPAQDDANVVAAAIKSRRPGTPATLSGSLSACWPLHPVTAALLGPVSRRKFGQNERSTFGFLASREPLGFTEHLDARPADWSSMYGPADYWDYLRANLEPAILASPDGHRWAQACEAIERAEAKGTRQHVALTKTIALIELFRSGSGLVADSEVLSVCMRPVGSDVIQQLLRDLSGWKVLIERKHLGAWGIYAGSDFDIEGAIRNARAEIGSPDLERIAALSDLQPVLAKRLYQETGTMRWFNRCLARLDGIEAFASKFQHSPGAVGTFVMCLPGSDASLDAAEEQLRQATLEASPTLLLGVPTNADRIAELGLELAAADRVNKTHGELQGDAVARRELIGRVEALRASLEEELVDAFSSCRWFCAGSAVPSRRPQPLTALASGIAQEVYPDTPPIFSELINRDEPSSNSVKARKDLMFRMMRHGSEERLGYEGFPADAGLYFTVLYNSGIHRALGEGAWWFADPADRPNAQQIAKWWAASRAELLSAGKTTTLDTLYQFWAAPPYGLKRGVMPILALAFFMAHRSSLALYVDGVFTPELSDAVIDEWVLDPRSIGLKHVEASKDRFDLLAALSEVLSARSDSRVAAVPLDIARALVGIAMNLPQWAKRTSIVSKHAQEVRAMLLRASDPHKVLFADLPTLLETNNPVEIAERLSRVLDELRCAYRGMLAEVRAKLLDALDHKGRPLEELRQRAATVKGITGDLRVDAFASRIEVMDEGDSAIEGLIGFGASKPTAQWVDRDIDVAMGALATLAVDFRRAEAMAPLRDRPSTRRVLGVVFGAAQGKDASGYVDIADKDKPAVQRLVEMFLARSSDDRPEVVLAALAEAGAATLGRLNKEIADG